MTCSSIYQEGYVMRFMGTHLNKQVIICIIVMNELCVIILHYECISI